jgi:CubicO group peptidase (beta-lactamase class C family)
VAHDGHENPYATLTERDLLDTLAATKLTRAPGSRWQYSNFAIMVLSYALAKRSGKDFETLLRERLLALLGMDDTYVAKRLPHVRLAQGHLEHYFRGELTCESRPTDGLPFAGVRSCCRAKRSLRVSELGGESISIVVL